MLVSFEVNGRAIGADVAPRTHLADFLRDHLLLTGTHLGCEHGVCGACTILLDGAPVRACIAYAATCGGARILTIEGLDDDPIMIRLRAAFSRAHALQCGYCTPGMLVTARDIVLRLPQADDDRIRLELSGNLCRCTGYNGIVKAIRAVLDEPGHAPAIPPPPVPQRSFNVAAAKPVAFDPPKRAPAGSGMSFEISFDLPTETVWAALRDPKLIAACIPGASLTEMQGDRLTGQMTIALGPIRTNFSGTAQIAYDDQRLSGRISGEGRDRGSNTRLSGGATFSLHTRGATSMLALAIDYTLQGPLAQLARGSIMQAVAGELAQAVGRNLAARLRGERRLKHGSLGLRFVIGVAGRGVWAWLRGRWASR